MTLAHIAITISKTVKILSRFLETVKLLVKNSGVDGP